MECIDKCTWMPMTIRWQQGHQLREYLKKHLKSGCFDYMFDYMFDYRYMETRQRVASHCWNLTFTTLNSNNSYMSVLLDKI